MNVCYKSKNVTNIPGISLKCDTDWVLSDIIGQLCVLLFLSFIFFSLVDSDIVIAVFF